MAKGQKKSTREAKKPKKPVTEKSPAPAKTSFGGNFSGTSYQAFYSKKTTSNG